jgi:hypothetical protein
MLLSLEPIGTSPTNIIGKSGLLLQPAPWACCPQSQWAPSECVHKLLRANNDIAIRLPICPLLKSLFTVDIGRSTYTSMELTILGDQIRRCIDDLFSYAIEHGASQSSSNHADDPRGRAGQIENKFFHKTAYLQLFGNPTHGDKLSELHCLDCTRGFTENSSKTRRWRQDPLKIGDKDCCILSNTKYIEFSV